MKEKRTAFIMMCGLVCLWGLDYVLAKNALGILKPMCLLFLKYSVGFILVAIVKFSQDRKSIVRVKDIPFFILCSITGEILYFTCEYTAMDYIPVSLITIILAFVPAVSILIERIVFKKKFTAKMALGTIICILGVAIFIGADFRELLQGRFIGYLLAFGAVLSWNAYNFITANVSRHYTGATMTFNQLLCTILILLPYALHNMPETESFTPGIIGGIIYLGLGSAGMGYLILVRGLKVLGPTISAMFSNFLPVTATFFGWLFLGESIGAVQIVGGVIVIISSCVVIKEKGKMEEQSDDRKIKPDDVD